MDRRELLIATDAERPSAVLPALAEIDWATDRVPLEAASWPTLEGVGAVLVDATGELARAVDSCRAHVGDRSPVPLVLVVSPAVMAAVKASWGFDDWLDHQAPAAELAARLRIACARAVAGTSEVVRAGPLTVDLEAYAARVGERRLDLTPTEFDVLTALASNAGQVMTRELLLEQAWGQDDFYGGIRKVDVYIRRLRAKLGPEFDAMIVTVRGVGYTLRPPPSARRELSQG